jgi:membrane-associated phospholipid phosphatase
MFRSSAAAVFRLLCYAPMTAKIAGIVLITALTAVAQDQTAIETKPATPVIKDKDLWEKTGFFHPFRRMPKFVLDDQAAIWSSPVHTAKSDVKWWAIFGGATAGLIATDQWTVKQLPNSSSQVSVSNWTSRFGSAYFLIPLSAGFYTVGSKTHDERFRETGLIAFETLIDVNIVGEALKIAADRARPTEDNGRGRFEVGPSRWNSGFPSGHAMNSWALASVIAHEYPKPWVKVVAYGLASTVVVSRVGARRHFPGDVMAGSAIGWFMGDYLFGKRHNRELDRNESRVRRALDHVDIGLSMN